MRFKTSIAFEELEGKSGSVVAKKNNAFGSLIPVVVPRQPRTQKIQKQRQNIKLYNAKWKNLTDEQRSAWSKESTKEGFGKSKFASYNSLLDLVGENEMLTPDSTKRQTYPLTPSLSINTDDESFNVAVSYGGAGYVGSGKFYYVVYAGVGTPTRTNIDMKNLKVIYSTSQDGGINVNLWNEYQDVWGTEIKRSYYYHVLVKTIRTDNVDIGESVSVCGYAFGSSGEPVVRPIITSCSVSSSGYFTINFDKNGSEGNFYLYMYLGMYTDSALESAYVYSPCMVRALWSGESSSQCRCFNPSTNLDVLSQAIMCISLPINDNYTYGLNWGFAPVDDPSNVTWDVMEVKGYDEGFTIVAENLTRDVEDFGDFDIQPSSMEEENPEGSGTIQLRQLIKNESAGTYAHSSAIYTYSVDNPEYPISTSRLVSNTKEIAEGVDYKCTWYADLPINSDEDTQLCYMGVGPLFSNNSSIPTIIVEL